MDDKKLWLRTICKHNGIAISDEQLLLLHKYANLLLDWNKKVNLISRKDEENFWQNHILHSVSITFKLHFSPCSSMLDLGTGGGLPGIPLKIICPQLQLALLDATQKKIHAVKAILAELSLSDVRTIWGRAEEMGKSADLKSRFDLVVARAVAPLRDLVKWSVPFLKLDNGSAGREDDADPAPARYNVNGPALIALKGGELDKEIQQVGSSKRVKRVDVINLVFEGSEQMSSADKKLVVVRF